MYYYYVTYVNTRLYIGVGSCILGYPNCEQPKAAPRKDDFVVTENKEYSYIPACIIRKYSKHRVKSMLFCAKYKKTKIYVSGE
jgi:hypothetical protein